ncbi:RNase P modulator RnpM [Saccharibacillus alkalitolerans]|uniref:YlxR family protein n=1 Tax=Saccharibacillus alkalitolerans TaxID=2705290 RepID=A0ABX0F520_9BACL|nr:YlxR family protein [Saccharibacillus alkalitolerans]NGZ75463.1 YlxR family protein [Saccharibacillus alkalitolerans]
MKKRKTPLRKCVASQEMLPKKELIRVVRTPEGQIEIDLTGKKSGRGAYLRADAECFRLAQKNKALDRALKQPVPAEIYEQLARDFIRVEHQFRELQERETDDE